MGEIADKLVSSILVRGFLFFPRNPFGMVSRSSIFAAQK